MARIQVEQAPRIYSFDIDNQKFVVQVEYKSHQGMKPIDVLILELEEVLESLRRMHTFEEKKPFSLPPVTPPNDSTHRS